MRIVEIEVPVIIGERYINGKGTGEFCRVKARDIYKIVKFSPKKNYHVPLFITKYGDFSTPLTLDTCKEIFEPYGILMLDTTNLVNVNHIVSMDERFGGCSVKLENGVEADVSRGNKDLVEDLLKKRDEEL